MSNLWLVTATRTITTPQGDERTRQLPTFLVDGDIQGFHDEAGAEHIVREILHAELFADETAITYSFGIVRAADNTQPVMAQVQAYRFTQHDEDLITLRMTEVAEQWLPKDSGPFHAPAIGEALSQIGHNALAMRADELTHDETVFIRKLARDLTGAIQEAREA